MVIYLTWGINCLLTNGSIYWAIGINKISFFISQRISVENIVLGYFLNGIFVPIFKVVRFIGALHGSWMGVDWINLSFWCWFFCFPICWDCHLKELLIPVEFLPKFKWFNAKGLSFTADVNFLLLVNCLFGVSKIVLLIFKGLVGTVSLKKMSPKLSPNRFILTIW